MLKVRVSIAGLMGVVLVASLGMAALRSGSATWAATVFLLACGVLALGLVGVASGGEAARAWWLGFAVFGWGYLTLAFWSDDHLPRPPTMVLVDALRSYLGAPGPPICAFPVRSSEDEAHEQIVQSFGSLIAAILGGMMAHVLFATPARSRRPDDNRSQSGRVSRRWLCRPAVIGLTGLVLFTTVALAGARMAPGLWAGVTVLLTWGLLGLAAVGATFGRGRQRVRWLGATLFGAGYLMLVSGGPDQQTWPQFATNRLLNSLRPWLPTIAKEYPTASDGIAHANARVLKALDRAVPMRFPRETPLEDVLAYIVAATRGTDGRDVPIYVDPVGLQEAEKTMQSPVSLVMDGVPLRTTLRLILRQLGMTYEIKDGLIEITSEGCHEGYHDPAYEDPYLLIGQCVLALLAAGLGGWLAPLVREPAGQTTSASPDV